MCTYTHTAIVYDTFFWGLQMHSHIHKRTFTHSLSLTHTHNHRHRHTHTQTHTHTHTHTHPAQDNVDLNSQQQPVDEGQQPSEAEAQLPQANAMRVVLTELDGFSDKS